MAYELAIFDFDGTLCDSFPAFLAAANEAAGRYGFRRIEEADLPRLRGYTALQVIRHVGMPMWRLAAVTRFIRARLAERASGLPLFPGVQGMLEALAAGGMRLAIASTNTEPTVRAILGGSSARVAHYACGASLFGKRPKLRRAARAAGVPAARAIYIGDELRDAEAARQEGMAFGAVAWGYTRAEALEAARPELSFSAPGEVAERLLATSSAPPPGGFPRASRRPA